MSKSQYHISIWKHKRLKKKQVSRDRPTQSDNEKWQHFDDGAVQRKHLPWLKWELMESLSQEGRSRSWWGWTHFSLAIWICRWGLHLPISTTEKDKQSEPYITDVVVIRWLHSRKTGHNHSPWWSPQRWPPVCTACRTTLLLCLFVLQMILIPLQLWKSKKTTGHIIDLYKKPSVLLSAC